MSRDPTWCHAEIELHLSGAEYADIISVTCSLPSHHFGGRRHERRLTDAKSGAVVTIDWPITDDHRTPDQTLSASNLAVWTEGEHR